MKILCLGDIVGKAGRHAVNALLKDLRDELAADLVIANAENAAGGLGLTPRMAEQLFRFGCDVLTLGDHTWDRPELVDYLPTTAKVIRPANFPEGAPGQGWTIVESSSGARVAVINLLGRTFMRYNVDCPFRKVDALIQDLKDRASVIVVDFHAETTSEKVAMGFYLDGRAAGVVGTHTHIQTADEKVLPQGTAYITDLGMTGPYDSVIGQKKEKIIQRFLSAMPVRFEVAEGDPVLHGVVMDIDETSGHARSIQRVQRRLA